ncbi:MAG: hypothetical protein EPN82_16345 [Bacteroidetes bacterium]|nr:MAG: hypothetical protein EPN82_16345 [Bacteroidota bacterium]
MCEEYYSGRDIYYLLPKRKMDVIEFIFYAFCIEANKYKYNYGRAANRTLKDILLPKEMPVNFKDISIQNIKSPVKKSLITNTYELDTNNWKYFRYDKLFKIQKGKRIVNSDMIKGNIPCIRPIDNNNGVYDYIDIEPNHLGNTITVNYNGSVAEAFYQVKSYFALDDVNILYPIFELNKYTAMFIITLIKKEKYRYNYGRKWHKDRMNDSIIKLPIDDNGDPDWVFMENYIKSLPYSSNL